MESKAMDNTAGLRNIPLESIRPNPYNPRKSFKGQAFDELVASIREKGVISPILVRSKKVDGTDFEIVYGERRYRATMAVQGKTIPAIVRELGDDEAFDVMTLENLARMDLTELEQAQSFKDYIERKGSASETVSVSGAIERLSKRTGIVPQYIRKRVAMLDLPRQVLKAWGSGKIYYGHLEQFMRLKNKNDMLGLLKETVAGAWNAKGKAHSVDWLKTTIDKRSPELKAAKFNIKGCAKCAFNSSMQIELYALHNDVQAQCQDRACFKDKQGAWLLANWKKSGYRRRYMTTGFRFLDDLKANARHYMDDVPKDCIGCESFISLLFLDGKTDEGQLCIGRDGCYQEKRKGAQIGDKKKKKKKSGKVTDAGPRVDWHGTYFRERFFENAIPAQMQLQKATSLDLRRLTLFALIKSNSDLDTWFAGQIGLVENEDDHSHYFGLDTNTVFEAVAEMDIKRIDELFREASARVIMQGADTGTRRRIAAYLGIKLDEEWAITADYMDKKTKQEILDMGVTLNIFDDEKAVEYLAETLKKKPGKYSGLKKPELVDLFLKSGVDLVGKVPEEILSAAERWKGSMHL